MRILNYLTFLLFLPAFLSADAFDVTSNGKTVVVTESGNGTLYVVNTTVKSKSIIRMGRSCMDWIKILQDSLILVHYHSFPQSEIYSISNGKRVFSYNEYLYPDKSRKFLYCIERESASAKYVLKKVSPANFQDIGGAVSLNLPDGFKTTRMFSLSKDGTKLVALLNKGKKSKLVMIDTGTGNLTESFGSFKAYDTYEMDRKPTGAEKKDIAFMDINADGSRVLVGNQFKILLFNGTNGKKIGEFAEDPTNNREDFSNTFFSPDEKLIYIGSIYKIYSCSPNTLEAIEHIVVDGQRTTFRTIDQYGSTIKKETYFSNEFYWNNVCVSSDNRYMFSICNPSLFGSGSKEPYFWRFDIIRNGNPYYFTYK